MQIIDGETYKREVEKRDNATVSLSVPRGKIFDREGKTVVDNKSLRTITFRVFLPIPRKRGIRQNIIWLTSHLH
ncbi:hypothetical protein BTJ45_04287 [Bacillus mycoides]|nr:hypothetical protein BTJ45_04287 [Bacillus mycoides]